MTAGGAAREAEIAASDPRRVLVPFDIRGSMSIAVAAKLSGKAGNTIRLWAERYGIGRKIGGDWHISRVALRIFLDGDTAALAAYHGGDRTSPLVRGYFELIYRPNQQGDLAGPTLGFTRTANIAPNCVR
jgi:hypothetical protein